MVRKMFFTPNEYNEFGYFNIQQLVFLCDKLVLWAPTGKFFDRTAAHKHFGESFCLTKEFFLDIVSEQNGGIQLAGRDFWYTQRDRRDRYAFPPLRWDEDFDDKIKDMLENDNPSLQCIYPAEIDENSRVLCIQDNTGDKKANDMLNSTKENDVARVSKAKKYAERYESLPGSLKERLGRYQIGCPEPDVDEGKILQTTEDVITARARRLLRDSYNTFFATYETGSGVYRNGDDTELVRIYAEISGVDLPKQDKTVELTFEKCRNFCELARTYNFKNSEIFMDLYRRSRTKGEYAYTLREWISELLFSSSVVVDEKVDFNFKKALKKLGVNVGAISTENAVVSSLITYAQDDLGIQNPLKDFKDIRFDIPATIDKDTITSPVPISSGIIVSRDEKMNAREENKALVIETLKG